MQRLNRMKNLWQASTHKNKLTFENMHFPVTTYGYNLWTISDHKRRKSRPLNLNIRGKTWEHCEIRRNRYSTRSECGRKLAYKQSNVLETSAVVILIITLDLKERWWKVWFPKEKTGVSRQTPESQLRACTNHSLHDCWILLWSLPELGLQLPRIKGPKRSKPGKMNSISFESTHSVTRLHSTQEGSTQHQLENLLSLL